MTAAAEATAVIAAAGSGERLGAGVPKGLVEIAGRPLVAWCLDAFAKSERVAAVVVAAPPGHEAELEALAPPSLRYDVVSGGASRAESVAAALALCDGDVVAIHDAARPLVTAALVDELVASLLGSPEAAGVVAATPILDTVKRVEDVGGVVVRTEDRSELWAAQTPQVFRTEVLREAIEADAGAAAGATDEAMLVERAGGRVLVHPSPARNLKVTTPDDLRVAELLLAQG